MTTEERQRAADALARLAAKALGLSIYIRARPTGELGDVEVTAKDIATEATTIAKAMGDT